FKGSGVSYQMIRNAKALRDNRGLFSSQDPKKGRPLDADTAEKVKAFYEDDKNSRVCSGQRDFVSVRNPNGSKEKVQKRLLLGNIKDLYKDFKEKYPENPVSVSKFYDLRPEWCITVDKKGMHNVCVCLYHQNAKLILEAVPGSHTYQDL